MKRQARRAFALNVRHSSVMVQEAEHGCLLEVLPLASRQGKHWIFGAEAADSGTVLHLFDDAGFPLAAYFRWILERFYPLKKMDLLLLVPGQQKWVQSLWFELLQNLGLASFTLATPLDCLARALKTGLLVYLEDGLAALAVCQRGETLETTSVGYGYFLTRAMRHQVQAHYGLRIEPETATLVWQKLSAGGQQVTVTGENLEGRRHNQMLILEDLKDIFAMALQPLIQEILYLQALYPRLDCFMLGTDAGYPSVQEILQEQLQESTSQPFQTPEHLERLLQNSIQHVLQEIQG